MRLMIWTLDCMHPGQSSTFLRKASMAVPNQISSKDCSRTFPTGL